MASSQAAMMSAALSARVSQSPVAGILRRRFSSPGVESSTCTVFSSLDTRALACSGPPAARRPSRRTLIASEDGQLESLDTRAAAKAEAGSPTTVATRGSQVLLICRGRT